MPNLKIKTSPSTSTDYNQEYHALYHKDNVAYSTRISIKYCSPHACNSCIMITHPNKRATAQEAVRFHHSYDRTLGKQT